MSIIGWIVIGLIAGGIARWFVKDDRSGCIYTIVVGVLGALIGGALMNAIDSRGVDEFSVLPALTAACAAEADEAHPRRMTPDFASTDSDCVETEVVGEI